MRAQLSFSRGSGCARPLRVFGLQFGEVFLVLFIFLAVLLAPYSGKVGGKIALLLRSKH